MLSIASQNGGKYLSLSMTVFFTAKAFNPTMDNWREPLECSPDRRALELKPQAAKIYYRILHAYQGRIDKPKMMDIWNVALRLDEKKYTDAVKNVMGPIKGRLDNDPIVAPGLNAARRYYRDKFIK
jgi:hypothetical protein